jgi:outer membrane usher protein
MFRRLIALLMLISFYTYSYGAEQAVMKVFLNNQDKGDHFFIMAEGGRMLLPPEDLLAIGLAIIPEGAESGEKGYIYLDSLAPAVRSSLDRNAAAIHIAAEPGLLKKNTVDLSYKREERVFHASDASAFFNYGISYTAGDGFDFTSMSIPLEVGFRTDGYLGISNFLYDKSDADEKFVRLLSSVIRDDTARLRRYTLGDFYAFSGYLGSGAILGGLSVARNFTMSPFLVKNPGLDITGMLHTPSDVEIYANGMLVQDTKLGPGEFEFQNLPNIRGAGEVSVIVRDAFGREETLAIPYYISTALLKPGLHDYSYNIGFKRKEFGRESFEYDDPAFLGFHRVGLSRTFTGGLRAEIDKNCVNAGPTAGLLLGNLGEFDTSIALSNSDGRTGYGFSANYTYAGRYFSGRVFMKGLSRHYANLVISPSDDKARFEGWASIGYNHSRLGSLSVAYSAADRYKSEDIERASLFYHRRVAKNISLDIIASRTDAEDRTYEVFAGLTFILGRDTSGNLGYRVQDDASVLTARLQQNPPFDRGFGYRVAAERRDNDEDAWRDNIETNADGFLQYRGAHGIYSAEYSRIAGEDNYTVGTSGGVVFINNAFYFTRPVTDGFALVKVGDFENAHVYYNNQEAGVTDKNGEIIIPGLVSYYPNSISINDTDFPVNYTIPAIEKLVTIPFRGGGMVSFDLRKLQAFTGRLIIAGKDTQVGAEYWGLEVQTDDRVIEAVVGKRGEFYLENIPAGSFPARLFSEGRECVFTMKIPASDDAMVDMGEVICEMH